MKNLKGMLGLVELNESQKSYSGAEPSFVSTYSTSIGCCHREPMYVHTTHHTGYTIQWALDFSVRKNEFQNWISCHSGTITTEKIRWGKSASFLMWSQAFSRALCTHQQVYRIGTCYRGLSVGWFCLVWTSSNFIMHLRLKRKIIAKKFKTCLYKLTSLYVLWRCPRWLSLQCNPTGRSMC